MRDLGIIPNIASEYKCSLIFKYFDLSKKQFRDLSEEVMIYENFLKSLYILFSIILEEDTNIKNKANFIIKWVREHSSEKLAGVHANREDFRIKYMNEVLSRK